MPHTIGTGAEEGKTQQADWPGHLSSSSVTLGKWTGVLWSVYPAVLLSNPQQDVLKGLWEFDLREEISTKLWKNKWVKRQLKEKMYTLVWGLYLTLVKLNHMETKYSNPQWKACQEEGTYFHMWWEYENILKF